MSENENDDKFEMSSTGQKKANAWNPDFLFFCTSLDTEQRYPLQEPSGLKISSTS